MKHIDFAIDEELADLKEQLQLTKELSKIDDHKFYYHTQLAYFGIIDVVADTIYRQHLSNRDRFVRLIANYSGWSKASCISIPHLYQLLRIYPFPEFDYARRKVLSIVDQITDQGSLINLDCDVSAGEVGTWFNNAKNSDLRALDVLRKTGFDLVDLTHAVLLYRFRNRLVHTMRGFGYAPRQRSTTVAQPYYSVMRFGQSDIDSEETEFVGVKFCLTYPATFIENLATDCIHNLRDYIKECRMPIARPSKFDFYFYEKLNLRGDSPFDT